MNAFQNILVALDAGNPDPGLLNEAEHLAKRHGARVTLLDVVRDFSWPARLFTPQYQHVLDLLTQEKNEQLTALADTLRQKGIQVDAEVHRGRMSMVIIDQVASKNYDLVVALTKGAASQRSGFFGTTATKLLRHCPCSVWLVLRGKPHPVRRVLASVNADPDDEPHSKLNAKIMKFATAACDRDNAELHVVFAWSLYGSQLLKLKMKPEEYASLKAKLETRSRRGFQELLEIHSVKLPGSQVHLENGDPVDVIPAVARREKIDLLVIGTVSHSGIEGFLIGNTAEVILNSVSCSVLAVKPDSLAPHPNTNRA